MGSDTPVPESAAPAPRRRRRWVRGLALCAGLIALAALVARAAVPGLLRSWAEGQATERLGAPVEIRDVDLSLTRGLLRLEGLQIASPLGEGRDPLATVELLEANLALLGFVSGEPALDGVRVSGVRVHSRSDGLGNADLAALVQNLESRGKSSSESSGEKKDDDAKDRTGPKKEDDDEGQESRRERSFTLRTVEVTDVEGTFWNERPERYRGEVHVRIGRFAAKDLRTGAGGTEVGQVLLEDVAVRGPRTPGEDHFLLLEQADMSLRRDGDSPFVDAVVRGLDVHWANGGDGRSNWRRIGRIVSDANMKGESDEDDEEDEAEREESEEVAAESGEEAAVASEEQERRGRRGGSSGIRWDRLVVEEAEITLSRQTPAEDDDGEWDSATLRPVSIDAGRDDEGRFLNLEIKIPDTEGSVALELHDDATAGGDATSARYHATITRFPYHLLTELPEPDEQVLALRRALADLDQQAEWQDGRLVGELALRFEEVELTEVQRGGLFSRLRRGELFSDDDGSAWAKSIKSLLGPDGSTTRTMNYEFDVSLEEWNPIGAFFLVQLQLQEARIEALRTSSASPSSDAQGAR